MMGGKGKRQQTDRHTQRWAVGGGRWAVGGRGRECESADMIKQIQKSHQPLELKNQSSLSYNFARSDGARLRDQDVYREKEMDIYLISCRESPSSAFLSYLSPQLDEAQLHCV